MELDKKHIYHCLFSLKGKCCWCIQNYLWDVWWKYYSH